MQPKVIQRIIGILLTIFSFTMLTPVIVDVIYSGGHHWVFILAFFITLLAGVIFWFPVKRCTDELRLRDGFVIVVMFWVVLGFAGSLPFVLGTDLDFTDAVFESISGLTTTGATVIVGLDELPRSLLFYRQQLQWLGGMGIIVLAVAIIPMLGIGGMQLYRAETPGPVKDNKLTPRITETAKALWYIYLGLTFVCAGAYRAAGMTLFDAISHSFSTIAIGGFSTHDASIGYFNSTAIEVVTIVFMLMAGVNFALHFMAFRAKSIKTYLLDPEFKMYIWVLLIVSVVTTLYLYKSNTYDNLGDAIHNGVFQVVSIGTTSGFTTTEFFLWPTFLPMLLLLTSFIGGCAGSTGGGLKVIRVLLLLKQGMREIRRLIHPSAQFVVKVGSKPLPKNVIDAVWGFFSLYVVSFCLLSLLVASTGLDLETSFSSVAACMNNLGPGLGEVGLNYTSINDTAKWVLCGAMLLGRLEIFTLLVLLTPAFWRD